MRTLQLQTALDELFAQVAAALQAHIQAGEEVPFELDSRSGRGRGSASLYCYRPLTARFIDAHLHDLRTLDAYRAAVEQLDRFDGAERYLIAQGQEPRRARGIRAAKPGQAGRHATSLGERALLALLHEVFEEQSDFELRPERAQRALERLDGAALATGACEVTLVATLHGLTIASPEIALARGLRIAHPDAIASAPEQALWGEREGDEHDHLLVVFTASEPNPRGAIARGVEVVHELLRAMRLFGDGRIALGRLAWSRVGTAPWEALALGRGGHPHGMLLVSAEQEDELRSFCELVSRRAPCCNELAWALRRFELGCERESEYEGLSDHLLALRALIGRSSEHEPDGALDGLLAARLAALCATPELRSQLVERTLQAIALERRYVAGTATERAGGLALAREFSRHLSALLRDVVCGHLGPDLSSLADELLLSDATVAPDAEQTPSSGEQSLGEHREPFEVLHLAV